MNYFDRYCTALVAENQEQGIPRERVQLIAMTCLMLASKFFDRRTPSIEDMSKIAQHVYTPGEFRQLELEILDRLKWLLHVPLPHTFFSMLMRVVDVAESPTPEKGKISSSNLQKWGFILIDLSGFEYDFLKYSPLVIAMAALLCSARLEAVKSEHILVAKLEMLRRECAIEPTELVECAQAVMKYYELCFPNSPKAENTSFQPVKAEELEVEPQPPAAESRKDNPSPQSVMASPNFDGLEAGSSSGAASSSAAICQ